MSRRVSLAAVLLMVAALQVLVLQLPPLVSAAAPRPPKTGGGSYSFATRGRAQNAVKFVKGFLKKNWVGVAIDVVDFIVQASAGDDKGDQPPPSSPPASGSTGPPPVSPPSTANGSAAADSAGLYYINLHVGSPAQTLTGVMDISSQLVWMFCDHLCNVCDKSPSFKLSVSRSKIVLPCSSPTCQYIFPARSCVYANEACTYYTAYGNNAFSTGYYVTDTFTSDGNSALKNMVFGCTPPNPMDTSGVSGVIGFGRGPLSLLSQLGITNFSYSLGLDGSIDLQLGNDVAVPGTDDGRYRVLSTRLLGSSMFKDLYYVGLTGIRVDGKNLAGIPPGTFDIGSDGTGGVSLSTTVPVTFLVEDAYTALKQAFVSKISSTPVDTSHLDGSLDLCYAAEALAGVNVPSLALVFRGEDEAVELKTANYLFTLNDGTRNLTCLTVLPSRGGSVLGSLIQTEMQMVYDLQGEQLTFVVEKEAAAPSLSPSAAPRTQVAWLLATVVPIALWWSLLF